MRENARKLGLIRKFLATAKAAVFCNQLWFPRCTPPKLVIALMLASTNAFCAPMRDGAALLQPEHMNKMMVSLDIVLIKNDAM